MRILATLALLVLAACASAPAPSAVMQASHRLTDVELRRAAEGKIICRNPDLDGACGSLTTLVFGDNTLRMDDAGVTEIEFYTESEFAEFVVSESWYGEAQRALFSELERHRAAGGHNLVRLTLSYEATYDPAQRAWCTSEQPESRVFNNARASLTRNRSTSRDGDWPVAAEVQAQVVDVIENIFASPNAQARFNPSELRAIRDSLRNSAATCLVFFGISTADGPELRGMATTWPENVASAERDALITTYPADAILPLN